VFKYVDITYRPVRR